MLPKKTKPKWGWRDAAEYEPVYLEEGDFIKLSTVLGVQSMDSEIRGVIQDAVLNFLVEKQRQPQIPHLSEVRAALSEILTASQRLVGFLEQLDTTSQNRLESASLPDNLDRIVAILEQVETKKSDFHFLSKTAKIALDDLPKGRSGRTIEKTPLRTLIIDLAIIYEKITGRKAAVTWDNFSEENKPYRGKYLDFTLNLLQRVDPEAIYSNSALGSQIKKSLRWFRSLNTADKPTFDSLIRTRLYKQG